MAVTEIKVGDRVYLRNAVSGFPGCVVGWDRNGDAVVYWDDFGEGRKTAHSVDSLILDQAFVVRKSTILGEEAA